MAPGGASNQEVTRLDKLREKPGKSKLAKRVLALVMAVGLIAALGLVLVNVDFTNKRVDRSMVRLGDVTSGVFEVKVNATGVLLPTHVEYLSAQVEGRVSELLVKPGDYVEKGQVLLELTNPLLVATAEEARWQWKGRQAERASFAVELENLLLSQRSLTLAAKFELERELLQLEAERELMETQTIPEIQYRKTKLNVVQFEQIYENEKLRLEQQIRNQKDIIAGWDAKVEEASAAFERARDAVDALSVQAGLSGIVQRFPLDVGQRLEAGAEIGQIASQNELHALLKVPARQASSLARGQGVSIDTRNGIVGGHVSRVDPAVSEGTVDVEVEIDDELPQGARPELPVEGVILLTRVENAVFIDKPSFARENAMVALYKLDNDERYARRVNAKFGRISVNKAQILEGLGVGDRVILSDNSDWQDYEEILLGD